MNLKVQGLTMYDLVRVQYGMDPEAINNQHIQVVIDEEVVPPITAIDKHNKMELDESHNKCGNYIMDDKNAEVTMILTGASTCRVKASMVYSIRLLTRIKTDFSTFMAEFGVEGYKEFISNTFGVPIDRIVVNELYEGSVKGDIYIAPDLTTEDDEQFSELNVLMSSINAKSDSLTFRTKKGETVSVEVEIKSDPFLD